jgi:hypothetical protein
MRHGDWHHNGHDRLCIKGGVRSWHQHWCAVFAAPAGTCDCRDDAGRKDDRPLAPEGGAPAVTPDRRKAILAVTNNRRQKKPVLA